MLLDRFANKKNWRQGGFQKNAVTPVATVAGHGASAAMPPWPPTRSSLPGPPSPTSRIRGPSAALGSPSSLISFPRETLAARAPCLPWPPPPLRIAAARGCPGANDLRHRHRLELLYLLLHPCVPGWPGCDGIVRDVLRLRRRSPGGFRRLRPSSAIADPSLSSLVSYCCSPASPPSPSRSLATATSSTTACRRLHGRRRNSGDHLVQPPPPSGSSRPPLARRQNPRAQFRSNSTNS